MLVEDSAGDADLASERLAEAPSPAFEIKRAATLAQAIELLAISKVDAIILDLNLPDSSGVETVRRLKIVLAHTPIIVVSGQVDERLRCRAIEEGAEDVFAKEEINSRLFWRSVLQIIERRREQQRQFQLVLDATPDAILVVSLTGVVRYVNQAALDLFGRSREDLLGEALGFSVKDEEPTEIVIARAEGDRVCEMRIVRMEWDDDRAYLASIRDITAHKHAERLRAHSADLEFENRRIQEASRLKSAFLANMSHELRTPLNAIIGFSELLYDGLIEPTAPQYRTVIGHILSSGNHLLQMINDVLDLAKVEAGKVNFNPERVVLRRLTDEVCAGLGSIATKRRVRVDVSTDEALADIFIDPARFKQILYNYLSNALKFAPEGGCVSVRMQPDRNGMFRMEVRDNGPGIAARDVPRLFTEFQQLEAGAAKRHQGTGLGLALVKRLVEAQGGQVGVSSVLGEGSVFYAVLPCHARMEEAAT